jgi:hypothetical protein
VYFLLFRQAEWSHHFIGFTWCNNKICKWVTTIKRHSFQTRILSQSLRLKWIQLFHNLERPGSSLWSQFSEKFCTYVQKKFFIPPDTTALKFKYADNFPNSVSTKQLKIFRIGRYTTSLGAGRTACFQKQEILSQVNDLATEDCQQGDQIGRIIAHWAVVFFGQFLSSCRNSANYGTTFSMVQVMCHFWEKMIGLYFGRLFHELIWSPRLSVRGVPNSSTDAFRRVPDGRAFTRVTLH